jgi:hypothetical protein
MSGGHLPPSDADTEDCTFQFQPFNYDAESLHRLVARFGSSPAEFKDLPLVKLLDSAMQVSHEVVSNCEKLASLLESNYSWPQPAVDEAYDRTCEVVAQAEIESRCAAMAPADFISALRQTDGSESTRRSAIRAGSRISMNMIDGDGI